MVRSPSHLIAGNWWLYRDTIDCPLYAVTFQADGRITGGSVNEAFWILDGNTVAILDASYHPTTICRIDWLRLVDERRMEGRFLREHAGRSDILHVFRKVGQQHATWSGPLPVSTTDVDEAVRLYRSDEDFTFILEPEGDVVSRHADGSSYRGRLVHGTDHPVFEQAYRQDPVFVHVLNDATLIDGVVAASRSGTPFYETTYQAGLRTAPLANLVMERDDQVFFDATVTTRFESAPALLLNTLVGNFGHWHVQSLPNLMVLDVLRKAGLSEADGMVLYVTNGFSHEPFRRPSIERMGYGGHATFDPWAFKPDGCIAFRKLIVPSLHRIPTLQRFPAMLGRSLEPLRPARATHAASRSRLYLSRKDVGARRHIINEDELVARLARLGFVPIVCGDLSYREQEEAFANAEMIVGPHGGALTNMAFSPPGTKILEIFHGLQLNGWYKNLANILGHRYGFVGFDPPESERDRGWDAGFAVDVEAVASLADSMLA